MKHQLAPHTLWVIRAPGFLPFAVYFGRDVNLRPCMVGLRLGSDPAHTPILDVTYGTMGRMVGPCEIVSGTGQKLPSGIAPWIFRATCLECGYPATWDARTRSWDCRGWRINRSCKKQEIRIDENLALGDYLCLVNKVGAPEE